MAQLRFIPLGVGDAFSALHYSSCLALEYDGAYLLIDCPHPIRKMKREASLAAGLAIPDERILGVALTHLHADHCSGLEGFGYYSFFLLQHKARLIAHPDISARLWQGCLAAGMEQLMNRAGETREKTLEDYFELLPVTEDAPRRLGPFEIECRKTRHHIPTTAFRIRAGDHCLGYSADTSFDPELIAWLAEADLIVHETNYGVHTPYEKLAALPEALRTRMRLIHYPDDFDLDGSVIAPLREGVVNRLE